MSVSFYILKGFKGKLKHLVIHPHSDKGLMMCSPAKETSESLFATVLLEGAGFQPNVDVIFLGKVTLIFRKLIKNFF